jgi:hypothetical protein
MMMSGSGLRYNHHIGVVVLLMRQEAKENEHWRRAKVQNAHIKSKNFLSRNCTNTARTTTTTTTSATPRTPSTTQ